MPEFPIPSARILLVSQIQGGRLPPCPPVPYAYGARKLNVNKIKVSDSWGTPFDALASYPGLAADLYWD